MFAKPTEGAQKKDLRQEELTGGIIYSRASAAVSTERFRGSL